MIQLTEFATAMKTPLRYSLIILTLGLFSSCAEQFREIRGSENRGNAFLGGGLTSSKATKRTDKARSETVTPHQTVIHVEQAVTEPVAENTQEPEPNPVESKIEKAETNPTSVIQGQKSSVSVKGKKGQFQSLKKTKLLKQAKILKKALLLRGNEINENLYELGIAGYISSIIGGPILIEALWGEGILIIIVLGVFFLLSLISSIWLTAKPTLEDGNLLKKTAIVIAALSVLIGLMILLTLIVGGNLFYEQ